MPERKADSVTSRDAKRYQAMKNRLFLFHLGLQAAFCAVLLATGWSRALKVLLLQVRDDFFSLNALYFTAFSLLGAMVALPLDFFEGFIWERRFGLSRQTLKGWATDVVKKGAIAFLVGLIFVEGLYFFLSEYPQGWWLGAAGFWFVLWVVLARIFPQVVLPFFYKPRPLEAGPLRERLMNFMQGARVSLKDIYVLDFAKKTVKANAMVAGLGSTKRIYLSDTLVSAFSPTEIEIVLAHEIGHYRHHDIRNLVGMGLAATLVSFYMAHLVLDYGVSRLGLQALSDIAGLPLFFLVVLATGLFLLPLQNGFSRRLEARADRFAIGLTQRPDVFIAMMKRLGEKNFSDFAPPRWVEVFLYDHPPIAKRIRMAEAVVLPGRSADGI